MDQSPAPETYTPPGGSEQSRTDSDSATKEPNGHRANYMQWQPALKIGWFWVMILAIIAAVVAAIIERFNRPPEPPKPLIITTFKAMPPPLPNTHIGASVSQFSDFLSETYSSGEPEVNVAYNADGGRICVLTKANSSWNDQIECIEGLNPKMNTPITILDWIGGPSIYFFTADNHLSGIDRVCHRLTSKCKGPTWKRSSTLTSFNIPVHNLSQISSGTWLYGFSSWLYFQEPNSTLKEFGIWDFRDLTWWGGRPHIEDCQDGSGLATSRWLNGTDEVFEVFAQVENGAIYERRFIHSNYVEFPTTVVESGQAFEGTSIAAVTVNGGNESMVLLAFIASDGFLKAQTRRNVNISFSVPELSTFSPPVSILKGNGVPKAGLATVSWPGVAKIFFVIDNKIMELSSDNSTGAVGRNWTVAELK